MSVAGHVVGSLETPGLVVLVGVTHGDREEDARAMAAKLWTLRVMPDADGRMNRSVADVGGGLLVISQFTLYGDVSRGRRPSFAAAAPAEIAEPLVDRVVEHLRDLGASVASGSFGAEMLLELANDGPVTVIVDVPQVGTARTDLRGSSP